MWLGLKRKIFILILIVLPICLLSLPSPVVFCIKAALGQIIILPLRLIEDFSYQIKGIFGYKALLRENEELQDRLAELNQELIGLKEAWQENERLRGLFSFKQRLNIPSVASRVIARDATNWLGTITIDKGKNSGLKRGMPVVSNSGLVGKVIEAGPFTSRVILLTDPNISVPAIIQRSREEGIVRGTLRGNCRMKYISMSGDVEAGDVVVTSGLGGSYPKGLLIGELIDLKEDTRGLTRYGEIEPATNFSSLEEVLVLKFRK